MPAPQRLLPIALAVAALAAPRGVRADDDGGWQARRPVHRPHITIAPELKVTTFTSDAALMAGAVVVHVRLGDPPAAIVPPAVLGLLALVEAAGRFGPAPL